MRKTHVRFCERADAGLITRRHPTRCWPEHPAVKRFGIHPVSRHADRDDAEGTDAPIKKRLPGAKENTRNPCGKRVSSGGHGWYRTSDLLNVRSTRAVLTIVGKYRKGLPDGRFRVYG